jgi:hypothetical protein
MDSNFENIWRKNDALTNREVTTQGLHCEKHSYSGEVHESWACVIFREEISEWLAKLDDILIRRFNVSISDQFLCGRFWCWRTQGHLKKIVVCKVRS